MRFSISITATDRPLKAILGSYHVVLRGTLGRANHILTFAMVKVRLHLSQLRSIAAFQSLETRRSAAVDQHLLFMQQPPGTLAILLVEGRRRCKHFAYHSENVNIAVLKVDASCCMRLRSCNKTHLQR